MIFCTRKTKKENVAAHISFGSFKKYSIDEYEISLCQVIFLNYEKYSNVNKRYNNFFHKLVEVVNKIAPLKTVRTKNTSIEWFDREIAEKLSLRDELIKIFKSSRLNIDWEIYKEARNDVQRLMNY